jgi:anti-anti-sigma regulatory factor
MSLVGMTPTVRSVFEITKLDRFFPIYETEQEALEA